MKLGLYIFLSFSNLILYAQNEKQNFSISPVDSVPLNLILPDHQVHTSDNEFLKKWNKTKFYVRSVYDYAKIASSMLEGFNDTLALLSNNRIKKRYLKRANKMLKNGFGDEIIDLGLNNGRADAYVPPNRLNEFSEYQFSVDNLEQFNAFAIKIVMSSTNESQPVKFKDFRAIALA